MAQSAEPILWEFRRAGAPLFVPLDFGVYRAVALLEAMPWRAIGIGAGISVALYGLARPLLAAPNDALLVFAGFALTAILIGIELLNRRDVLTPTHLVQQRGLFGGRRTRTPLHAISRVEFHYPRWGEAWNVGDIHVVTDGGEIRLTAVADAAAAAQRILDAKARLESGKAP